MNFYIMTLFPEMVMDGLNTSIIGRAVNKGLLSIEALNIRDYAFNKHHSVDDYPYGGGAGMLMQAEPVYQCYDALARQITERKAKATEEKLASGEKKEMSGEQKRTRVIYLSPQGKTFNQSMAEEFAQEEDLPVWNIADIPADYPESSRTRRTHHYEVPPEPAGISHRS